MPTNISKDNHRKPSVERAYRKNGVEIVFLPLERIAYCGIYEDMKFIFIKSELAEDEQKWLVEWGLKQFAEGNVKPDTDPVWKPFSIRPVESKSRKTITASA